MNRVVKASLRPVRNLVISIVLNVALCSFLYWLAEDAEGPLGEFYWAITTGTTTGYGDISPETVWGRIIAMWLMVSSVVFVAVTTAQITSALVQDPHLFSDDEQKELLDDADDTKRLLIQLFRNMGWEVPEYALDDEKKESS